ncbi:MAG: type I-C CRISPR-associated protein Cas8c/Csd1 [Opitutaceae bacterium]
MILQALLAYAERENLGDADFEPVGVRWQIPLTAEGKLAGRPIPLSDDPSAKKPPAKTLRRPFTSPNELTQTGDKARSYFLCDSLERATLYLDPKTPEKHENRRAQHRYFRSLLTVAAEASPTATPALRAVLAFLDDSAALAVLHADLVAAKAKPNENVTFAVDGVDLLSIPALLDFWRQRRRAEAAAAAESREVRVCLATGERAATLDTTEKIKGIPGGLAQGTNLISFDKSSFCSFGLEQAQNAPLSPAAELKIRTALNTLVQKARDQRLVFNDTVYLHWTREPIASDPLDLLATADPDGVATLLKSVQAGAKQLGLDANAYYCLGLSGNGARIVVRDWLETTVDRVQSAIAAWFDASSIIDPDGIALRTGHKFGAILYALVRAELDELPPPLPAELFYSILRGAPVPLPRTALAAALRRQSLDQRKPDDTRDPRLNPARLGLIRAVLNRLPNQNITMNAQLDPGCSDPAYLCGRLFAVFDRLQYLAQGQLNAGISERFYASACVTPSLVMGRLFRNSQFHLAKAGGGIAENIRKDFEDLTTRLGCKFPPTLSLEEQGRFALGFYHQKADYRRQSAERREERASATSDQPATAAS